MQKREKRDNMQNLNDLVSPKNYLASFKTIADILLNQSKLVVGECEFEITEIEFYYYDEKHKDTFTHKDELQKTSNRWYVHSGGRGGIYVTFGNENAFGGILIRGLKEIESKNYNPYLDGPDKILKKVKEILSINDRKTLRHILTDIETNPMRLESIDSVNKLIYQGPRLGLPPNINDEFLVKPYRFVVDIDPRHRFPEKSVVYLYTRKLYPELTKEMISDIQERFDFKVALDRLKKPAFDDARQIRRERIISYLEG